MSRGAGQCLKLRATIGPMLSAFAEVHGDINGRIPDDPMLANLFRHMLKVYGEWKGLEEKQARAKAIADMRRQRDFDERGKFVRRDPVTGEKLPARVPYKRRPRFRGKLEAELEEAKLRGDSNSIRQITQVLEILVPDSRKLLRAGYTKEAYNERIDYFIAILRRIRSGTEIRAYKKEMAKVIAEGPAYQTKVRQQE